MYICFDGQNGDVNLKFDYNGAEYLFAEFVYKNIKLVDTLKKLLKLKVKNSTLYVKIGKVVDKFNSILKKIKKVNLHML